ncbi:MAG: DUF2920 family protein [Planctomycetaceae bacterium]
MTVFSTRFCHVLRFAAAIPALSPGLLILVFPNAASPADDWPLLPDANAAVEIPAQQWQHQPGPRRVRLKIHYPSGKLTGVNSQTGIMLTLHNWGGTDCQGTASPTVLSQRLNVVAVCVDYLQSGRRFGVESAHPYDFGYLQALDALRGLWFVYDGLVRRNRPFDKGRLFCTGGSGGGNVALMANKLAPRTFACVIDMCGMNKLSPDIAFHLPGGSGLDARWSRDPQHVFYLSPDQREIRFVGQPEHLAQMKRLGAAAKVIVVHGAKDTTCPTDDAREMVANMRAAGIDVEPHFIDNDRLDGTVFTSTGHALGNRTEIVFRVAGRYLRSDGRQALDHRGPNDFELRDTRVQYHTPNGSFTISYANGYPTGRFRAQAAPPEYPEHQDLTYVLQPDGRRTRMRTAADWRLRRSQVLEHLQQAMGRMPGASMRVPLHVKQVSERKFGSIVGKQISYQSDAFDRVPAWLLLPPSESTQPRAAVLCLHQTVRAGKNEPVGLSGSPTMHYGIELARRGYVVLAPDYPSLGDHTYDFQAFPEYASGTMKAIWDNRRGVDLLESLPQVDGRRIGVLGHSLGGHSAMFTAAFEPRLRVIVSSCGFTRFHKDDMPSWTGPRYMPRIADRYGNDADRVPFDFTEIVASFAPRPFLACAATNDTDFDVGGVRDVVRSARTVYELLGVGNHLAAEYPVSPHDFPAATRSRAYEFLDQHLHHIPSNKNGNP